MLRRLRSALTVGALWGAIWLPLGVLLGWTMRWFTPPLIERTFESLGAWTLLGGMSGFVFALLLALLERGQRIEALRPSRLALWGIIAGIGVPLVLFLAIVMAFPVLYFTPGSGGTFVITGVAGACSALATIRLAQPARIASPTVASHV